MAKTQGRLKGIKKAVFEEIFLGSTKKIQAGRLTLIESVATALTLLLS